MIVNLHLSRALFNTGKFIQGITGYNSLVYHYVYIVCHMVALLALFSGDIYAIAFIYWQILQHVLIGQVQQLITNSICR